MADSQQRAHKGNHEANPYEEIHEVDEETGEIFVSIKRRPSPSPSSHAAMAYELDGEDAVDFAGMMNALGVEVDEAAADAEAWPAEAADDEVKAEEDPELEEALAAVARADGADPPEPPPDPELEEALAAVQSLERAALARSSSAEHKRADAEFAAALSASEVYEEEARSSRRRGLRGRAAQLARRRRRGFGPPGPRDAGLLGGRLHGGLQARRAPRDPRRRRPSAAGGPVDDPTAPLATAATNISDVIVAVGAEGAEDARRPRCGRARKQRTGSSPR